MIYSSPKQWKSIKKILKHIGEITKDNKFFDIIPPVIYGKGFINKNPEENRIIDLTICPKCSKQMNK